MAMYMKDGYLKYVDKNGDVYMLRPVTRTENIEGHENLVPLTHEGLTALLAKGPIVLNEGQDYGTVFPNNAVKGQLFLMKV